MKHEVFTVVYDGEGMADHTMDVRDLAPALLSLSELISHSGNLLYGSNVDIKLHVKALEAGCFTVDLTVITEFLAQIKDLLVSDGTEAAINLGDLLQLLFSGGVFIGLFKLIKVLKGKNPTKVTVNENTVTIETADTTIEVPSKLLPLYQDIGIRQAAMKVVEPLEKQGIESIEFRSSTGAQYENIVKEDVGYFRLPEISEEVLLNEKRKAAFSIVSLAFREENKWRLHDGNNTIYATIKDADFLARVEANDVSFRKSDVLICMVEDVSTRDENGLKTEHNILEVLEHKPAMTQLPMDIPDE
ncbi:MAG: hypothetical protein WDZ52_00870 [Pseudohongiellaceae bacterium]